MFAVNDKVVCVDDSPGHISGKKLTKGEIYCVDGFDGNARNNRDGKDGVFLVGVKRNHLGWQQWRFRKVSDVRAENRVKRAARKEASHE